MITPHFVLQLAAIKAQIRVTWPNAMARPVTVLLYCCPISFRVGGRCAALSLSFCCVTLSYFGTTREHIHNPSHISIWPSFVFALSGSDNLHETIRFCLLPW